MTKPFFTIIIPIYNEQESLLPLVKQLEKALPKLKKPTEVIFINDGSSDKSSYILNKLKSKLFKIIIIQFTRNFGQTAAFSAGFDQARGKIIITMDGDLQNDPQDIGKMFELMKEQKADIVVGWRSKRRDPLLRSLISNIANRIISGPQYGQVHDLGCSLRVYKKETLTNLKLYGEMHRFIPILASASGAKLVEMKVRHHPRQFGKSKYGLIRTFKVLLDLITVKFLTDFQTKPIYMFGFTGIALIFLSFIAGLYVVLRHIFFNGVWVSPMLFIMTILFTVGVVCILMGLLAEIQIRTWYESSGKKSYIIKK